jgi:hypothetical protein
MKMNQVWEMARELGIKVNHPKKGELIRMIQRAEGNFDCFGTAKSHCDQQRCCFREDCLTLNQ